MVPYIEIYRLMDAAFGGTCTEELVVRVVAAVAAAVVLRFVLFGASGVVSHKGAYGALFKVRCMVAEHMAKVPLGALNERRTGDIKTVLNEDIEKLELFLAHNLPDLVCYLVGPVVVFAYLMTVNIPLALISLVPLVLAAVVMAVMFRNTDDLMDRANRSITALHITWGANPSRNSPPPSMMKTPCGTRPPAAWGPPTRPLWSSLSAECCSWCRWAGCFS